MNKLMTRSSVLGASKSSNTMDSSIKKVKQIIADNIYITLATVGDDNIAWSSPVYVDYDEQYNFYWASGKDAKHSRNIQQNNIISFVIFDSTVPWGEGQGVYMQAKAYELAKEDEIRSAFKYRYKRVAKPTGSIQEFMGKAPRRIYKAVPEKVWINVDSQENGYFVDKRKELSLSNLK